MHVANHLRDNFIPFFYASSCCQWFCLFSISIDVGAVVIVWKLDLQLPVQSVPISTKVVSWNEFKTFVKDQVNKYIPKCTIKHTDFNLFSTFHLICSFHICTFIYINKCCGHLLPIILFYMSIRDNRI